MRVYRYQQRVEWSILKGCDGSGSWDNLVYPEQKDMSVMLEYGSSSPVVGVKIQIVLDPNESRLHLKRRLPHFAR